MQANQSEFTLAACTLIRVPDTRARITSAHSFFEPSPCAITIAIVTTTKAPHGNGLDPQDSDIALAEIPECRNVKRCDAEGSSSDR